MIRLDTSQYLPKISILWAFQLHVLLLNDINKTTVDINKTTENQIDDAKDIDDFFRLLKEPYPAVTN